MKVRKFVSWAILVAMQSAAVVVSIPLGVFLSEKFYLLPQWLLTTLYVTLGPRDLLPLTLHFAVSAFLIFGISTAFLKSRTLRDGLGAVVSFYCLGATLALGAWSVFLGAQVRIVPEILFGTGLAATAMFLVLIFSVQAVAYGTAALPRRIANFFILLFRMPVRRHALLLLIVFSLSPIVAARVFKENRSFADFLTATVMQFRAEGGSAHVLREAFPGVTFQQPVDLMPTLRSNAQQFGFLFGRQDYPLRRDTCPQDLDLGLEQPHLRVVPGHEKLCQEDDKEGERLIHLARLHHGAKKMAPFQRDGPRLHFGTPLRKGAKRRSRQMTDFKPGLGVWQGLSRVAASNSNASSVFRCQSQLNQMTIQTIRRINENNSLEGGEGWISGPSPPPHNPDKIL